MSLKWDFLLLLLIFCLIIDHLWPNLHVGNVKLFFFLREETTVYVEGMNW